MMTKKAVVLLSGGLDSTTCLAYANSKSYECYALSFDYGQRHCSELMAAKNIAELYNVKKHEVISLHSIGRLGGSSLTDSSQKIEAYSASNEIPATYVPARNTIMLSIALGWAEILEINNIFIGVSAIDYSGYPDCRPEYIQAFNDMANLATKNAVLGNKIKIETPLINLSKAETIKLGIALNVDYSKTISCYQANELGQACAKCDSCFLRKQGFNAAKIDDPTNYITN